MAKRKQSPAALTPSPPVQYVRFTQTVQGVVQMFAEDVAANPKPEALRLVRHKTISEANYRTACKLGHRNAQVEEPR